MFASVPSVTKMKRLHIITSRCAMKRVFRTSFSNLKVLLFEQPGKRFVLSYSLALPWLFAKFTPEAKDSSKGETSKDTLLVASEFLEARQVEDAIKLLNETISHDETLPPEELARAHGLLSYAYWKLSLQVDQSAADDETNIETSIHDICQKSLHHATEAYKLHPNSAMNNKVMALSVALNNSSFLLGLKNLPVIIYHLEKAVELDNCDWESHHFLGSFYLSTAKFTGPLVWFYLTYVLGVPKKTYDEALYHLLKSEELAPRASCANLTKLAVVYYKKSDYENSKKFIELAVNYDCKTFAEEKEKENAAQVLIEWAKYSSYYKTVQIRT